MSEDLCSDMDQDEFSMAQDWDFDRDSPYAPPFDPAGPIVALSDAAASPPWLSESAKQRSVVETIGDLIGTRIRQKELLLLRQGLFAAILPPTSRDERRLRPANARTFERFRESILPWLGNPNVTRQIVHMVLQARGNREREVVLLYIYRDQLNKA
jgi:hypothetical protein